MPYLPNVNSYLHQSSLLLQAYPETTRITTKYSLPRQGKPQRARRDTALKGEKAAAEGAKGERSALEQPASSSTLVFKTFEPTAGICLKYRSNKAAEVGRLMLGLGRLARGEVVEEPGESVVPGQRGKEVKLDPMMDVDSPLPTPTKVPDAAGASRKAKKRKGKK